MGIVQVLSYYPQPSQSLVLFMPWGDLPGPVQAESLPSSWSRHRNTGTVMLTGMRYPLQAVCSLTPHFIPRA